MEEEEEEEYRLYCPERRKGYHSLLTHSLFFTIPFWDPVGEKKPFLQLNAYQEEKKTLTKSCTVLVSRPRIMNKVRVKLPPRSLSEFMQLHSGSLSSSTITSVGVLPRKVQYVQQRPLFFLLR